MDIRRNIDLIEGAQIRESLNSSLPWEETFRSSGLRMYRFVSNGIHYDMTIAGSKYYSIQFSSELGQGITGAGNAFRVLATVKEILVDFIKNDRPVFFAFGARKNQPSRVKLFTRLARDLSQSFPDYDYRRRW